MSQPEIEITCDTTIMKAIEILKRRVEAMANSDEVAEFNKENAHWSNLFGKPFKPYQAALRQYEEVLELNNRLSGKHPENRLLTIKETFLRMSDQERLSLFHRRINTGIPGIFDEYLKAWWLNRY